MFTLTMNERFSLDGGYIGELSILFQLSWTVWLKCFQNRKIQTCVVTCRNPGMDLGTKRRDVDELSHSNCSRKSNQVFQNLKSCLKLGNLPVFFFLRIKMPQSLCILGKHICLIFHWKNIQISASPGSDGPHRQLSFLFTVSEIS